MRAARRTCRAVSQRIDAVPGQVRPIGEAARVDPESISADRGNGLLRLTARVAKTSAMGMKNRAA
jgi:hypothetical protein